MQSFTTHNGQVVPLDRANIDTDQIIPKQYLKSIKRTGFGDYLFDAWRFRDQGDIGMTPNEREINHEFVLNAANYQGASVLVTKDNFGCGSSREHAVWALLEYGFRVVIAPSFADIFYGNCFKNGLLPIVLNVKIIEEFILSAESGLRLTIDLDKQEVTQEVGLEQDSHANVYSFDIAPGLKQKMLTGMDDIDLTLAQRDLIETFEKQHKLAQPWLFNRSA